MLDGGSLAYPGSGDFLYAFKGNNTTDFWRYSITNNTWITLTSTPQKVWFGGSLSSQGGDSIYALRGGNTVGFWRFILPSFVSHWKFDETSGTTASDSTD
ncbi:MAG: hypothetical protein AABX37_04720, partial [Nanoarchaeota archaeon]